MRNNLSSDTPHNNEKNDQAPALNVLIIAHKQSQLASAAAFLSRRGVPCTVKSNIKDGIQFITTQKATLVFLSWNLPNSNILKTHQLLTQNFKVECVVFAERPDGKTAAELTGSRLPEIMQAPVSGPGLYMRIQKLLKAKEDLAKGEKTAGPKTNNSQDSNHSDKIVLKSSKAGEKDNDTFVNLGSNQNKNKSGIINFQSHNAKYSEEDYETEDNDPNANDISMYLDQLNDEPIHGEWNEEGLKADNMQDSTSQGDLSNTEIEALNSEERKSRSNKKEISYGSVVNVAKKNQATKNSWRNSYEPGKPNEVATPGYEQTKQKEALIIDFKPRQGIKDSESILAQKTFEAIEKSVRPAYEDYAPVDKVSKAKIFNIHTPRFRGYLIFVVPMFNEFERSVVASIRTNLEALLKEQNEYLLYFEELNIDLEQTDFLGWAQENAEFFVQTVDHKTEIICAYYPQDPSLPKVTEKYNKMATINIKDLKLNSKTNFNLYIHLPKNNKFVCYMKPGEVITEKHKNKFEKHKMDNLHIRNEEVTSFKEYFVSYQIQDIISKTAEKKAS
jgi:DNA-binding response OmpR family regulator